MVKGTTVQQLFDLKGKVFLIAGGAHNLGLDMAYALAEAGADGVVTSRKASSAEEAALDISESTGQTILGMPLDATKEDEVKNLFINVINRFDRVDILVNCVGGGNVSDNSTIPEERNLSDWDLLVQTNLTSIFLLCKFGTAVMKKQGSGSIINIASIAGIIGRDRRVYPVEMPMQSIDYAAAKAGVIGLTRDLAAYLGPDGVRVNAISPGGFERGQLKKFIEAYSEKTPLRRMGRDGIDIKGAILFLSSEASAYVTGHNLVVDGGFTICQ
jgi:NAD(P)-dependent dehydrogenase (short-subunit alcohol dehydrogenase family)